VSQASDSTSFRIEPQGFVDHRGLGLTARGFDCLGKRAIVEVQCGAHGEDLNRPEHEALDKLYCVPYTVRHLLCRKQHLIRRTSCSRTSGWSCGGGVWGWRCWERCAASSTATR